MKSIWITFTFYLLLIFSSTFFLPNMKRWISTYQKHTNIHNKHTLRKCLFPSTTAGVSELVKEAQIIGRCPKPKITYLHLFLYILKLKTNVSNINGSRTTSWEILIIRVVKIGAHNLMKYVYTCCFCGYLHLNLHPCFCTVDI